MPQDLQFNGKLAVEEVLRLTERVDVVYYGEKPYARQYFAIEATDNAGPAAGTSTTLISSVASSRFVILWMQWQPTAVSTSTAAQLRVQFFSAGVPTNHTGQYFIDLPAGAVNAQHPPFLHDGRSGPMFVTDSGQNFRVNVVSQTAGQAVRVAGYGCYITIPG